MYWLFFLIIDLGLLPTQHQGRIQPIEQVYSDPQAALLKEKQAKILPPRRGETWLSSSWLELDEKKPAISRLAEERSLRTLFYAWQKEPSQEQPFVEAYFASYKELDGVPSIRQLQVERLYRSWPWLWGVIAFYVLALILPQPLAWPSFIAAFSLHTALLTARIYILERPPVSSMEETLLYVPWVGALLSLYLRPLFRLSAALALVLLPFAHHLPLSTLQPVLNSRLWLTVHVLMVVASYAAFLLAGIVGHLYYLWPVKRDYFNKILPLLIYIGLSLLIPGTLLGAIWAAQSWGRFWDWDPKEAWAFISIAFYLLLVHSYRFQKIALPGLAWGSVFGLMVISFTWYGVNYILGTGLHSYGFGQGGYLTYSSYVLVELLFLLFVGRHAIKRKT